MVWAEVGRHGEGPALDQEALDAYLAVWPERYVRWEPKRGMWEIRQVNPDTGVDERMELVFEYRVEDPTIKAQLEEFDPEQRQRIEQIMVETRSPVLRKMYRPFDLSFVRQRLRERSEFLRLGPDEYSKALYRKNATIQERRLKGALAELGYFFKHEKRQLAVLAGEGEAARNPQVQGTEVTQ